jgi:hypothetical protein
MKESRGHTMPDLLLKISEQHSDKIGLFSIRNNQEKIILFEPSTSGYVYIQISFLPYRSALEPQILCFWKVFGS